MAQPCPLVFLLGSYRSVERLLTLQKPPMWIPGPGTDVDPHGLSGPGLYGDIDMPKCRIERFGWYMDLAVPRS